jgi:hypothetical protein
MRDFGDTDDRKKLIRINAKKSIEYGKSHDNKLTKGGSLGNSILHEIIHAKDPSKTEKQVYDETPKKLAKMSNRHKKKLYNLIK